MEQGPITPVKTQHARNDAGVGAQEPVPTVDERLETIGAALETALDPDATAKQKADALVNVRKGRKARASSGERQE